MSHTGKRRARFHRGPVKVNVRPNHGQPLVPDVGVCSEHNKHSYISRALAKRVCKYHKMTGDHMVEPYRCAINEQLWHVGGVRSK